MSKRLEMLEKLAAAGKADSFALYALALEYKSASRIDDALRTFEQLRATDPDYVPQYLMAGSMLQAAGRFAEARDWLQAGVKKATDKGDAHAASEMTSLLEGIADS